MMTTTPSGTISDENQPASAPSFEQTLGRLEEIVHLLEEGRIGLDEALERYEEGVRLLRKAYEMLENAERRISLLSGVDSEGNPILRPVDDSASFSLNQEFSGTATAAGRSDKPSSKRGRRQADPDSQ